ncbi:MAG: hypothetical protein HY314_05385 [Acidobacteria bacterium]|nr:hypothetical protein [Acidobacteriota bacterium]
MVGERRQTGDIIHLIEPKAEKKHLLAGIMCALLLYGAGIGKTVYDYWQQGKQWRQLLNIEVVDLPGSAERPRADILELTQPLYYPPGLVKPKPEIARQERPRRQQKRQQQTERTDEAQQEQTEESVASNEGTSTQQPDVQAQIQLLQQGMQRARTLNIGPIREQIANIYKAQQEGRIALGEISVAVNFRVREDGAFTHVRLIESSGIPEVDNAALIIVDELGQLRALAPLKKTDSVTLRLSIGRDVELQTIVASSSPAEAAQQVSQLNGLLMAARLWSAAQKQTKTVEFLSNIEIKQEGTNIVASARVPRTEASRYLKKNLGSGS